MRRHIMDGTLRDNDISKVVEADRAHIWHHLTQHKPFENAEPLIVLENWKYPTAHVLITVSALFYFYIFVDHLFPPLFK